MLYFDWAATALPSAQALDSFSKSSLDFPGNPSSRHPLGSAAALHLEEQRGQMAKILGIQASELYFCSGGTEANNTVLKGCSSTRYRRILLAEGEHPSVRLPLLQWKNFGTKIDSISPESNGLISPDRLERMLTPETDLVVCMSVSNQTGAIHPIGECIKRAKRNRPRHFHCDAVQAIGKIPLDKELWTADTVSFSAHKIGAPRGIGFLYSRNIHEPFLLGGGQERGFRSGTENTAGIAAMRTALCNAVENEETLFREAHQRMSKLIQSIEDMGGIPVPPNRSQHPKLYSPYILSAAFPPIPGEVLQRLLAEEGVCVSTGSACSSNRRRKAPVRLPGISMEQGEATIRISQGYTTTQEELEKFLLILEKIYQEQKYLLGR